MRRGLFLLLVLVLSLSAVYVGFAQEEASADLNACLTGGSMEGQCDFPTAAEDEWAWTCGYYVGLYDHGEISRAQIPDWCYYREAGAGTSDCLIFLLVDIRFIGAINTADNVAFYNSMDGSCTGSPLAYWTIVEAPDLTAANQLCLSLTGSLRFNAVPLEPALIGHENYWMCTGAVT